MSITCSLRKCFSFSFLPRTPSAFQQASLTFVPLGRAVILGYEEYNNFEDCLWAGFSCWECWSYYEMTACQLYTGHAREVVEEISNSLQRWQPWLGGNWWVSLKRMRPLGLRHIRPRYSDLGLTSRAGRSDLGSITRFGWGGRLSKSSLSLDYMATPANVVSYRP